MIWNISDASLGTEELAHMEIVSAILYQLTRNLTPEEIKASGFDTYFVDHTTGIYPVAASGTPFTAAYFQSKGDPITDLVEDMAAEQKARSTYDNILRLADDPDVRDPINFYVKEKLFIFRDSAKVCVLHRIILIQRIFMHVIRRLINNAEKIADDKLCFYLNKADTEVSALFLLITINNCLLVQGRCFKYNDIVFSFFIINIIVIIIDIISCCNNRYPYTVNSKKSR